MLDHPQVTVGGDHVVGGLGLDALRRDQGADRVAGRRLAQAHVATAPDQLLGLGEELDLANPAASDLDVVAAHRDMAEALDRVDLPLDRMDVLDRREVEMLAPDEGREAAQEALAGLEIAGDHPRLDHRRAFPVLAHALVVGLGGQHRHGERRRGGVGAQPEIGAEDIAGAGRGAILHQSHQIAGQAHEERLHAAPAAILDQRGLVQHDEVDVAGIVELARAELAHADDDEAGVLLRRLRIGQRDLAGFGGAPQQVGDGDAEAGLGELAHGARHAFERPGVGDVGQGDRQRHLLAGHAQGIAQPGGVAFGRGALAEPPQQIAEDSVGALG